MSKHRKRYQEEPEELPLSKLGLDLSSLCPKQSLAPPELLAMRVPQLETRW